MNRLISSGLEELEIQMYDFSFALLRLLVHACTTKKSAPPKTFLEILHYIMFLRWALIFYKAHQFITLKGNYSIPSIQCLIPSFLE